MPPPTVVLCGFANLQKKHMRNMSVSIPNNVDLCSSTTEGPLLVCQSPLPRRPFTNCDCVSFGMSQTTRHGPMVHLQTLRNVHLLTRLPEVHSNEKNILNLENPRLFICYYQVLNVGYRHVPHSTAGTDIDCPP